MIRCARAENHHEEDISQALHASRGFSGFSEGLDFYTSRFTSFNRPSYAKKNQCYPLVMTNSLPWEIAMALIEIDGFPNLKLVIFHGYVK
jgi:hypothetical protein